MPSSPGKHWRICLHDCHKPETLSSRINDKKRGIHIYIMESNGKKSHSAKHDCNGNCRSNQAGLVHRKLQDADWIKFGHAIAVARGGRRLDSIIAAYREAWSNLYATDPPMDVSGMLPADHLNNSAYQPTLGIPWFSYPSIDQNSQAENTSSPSHLVVPAEPTPKNTYSSRALSRPQHNVTLSGYLDVYKPVIALEGPYPHISGFGYDTKSYMSHPIWKPRLMRLVFVVSALNDATKGLTDAHNQRAYIDMSEFNYISAHAPNAVIIDDSKSHLNKDNRVHVIISSWVLMMFRFKADKETPWEIQFMSFSNFASATSTRTGVSWDCLLGADLVVGGVDFSGNFLEDSYLWYDLSPREMEKHWTGLVDLQERTLIWPQPQELYKAGSKCYLHYIISMAAVSEGYPHPVSATCEPTVALLEDILSGEVSGVLKRDWSNATTHVFTKHSAVDHRSKRASIKALERAIRAEFETYKAITSYFRRPVWFIQPYLPAMILLGEIRLFIVNGIIINTIITTPIEANINSVDAEQPISVTPIEMITNTNVGLDERHRITFNGSPFSPVFFNAATSVQHYALRMLSKLIAAEEYIGTQDSGLRVFTRFDISVFSTAPSGEYHFVLNEVERGHCVGLFARMDKTGRMDVLRQELSHTLHYLAYRFQMVL